MLSLYQKVSVVFNRFDFDKLQQNQNRFRHRAMELGARRSLSLQKTVDLHGFWRGMTWKEAAAAPKCILAPGQGVGRKVESCHFSWKKFVECYSYVFVLIV